MSSYTLFQYTTTYIGNELSHCMQDVRGIVSSKKKIHTQTIRAVRVVSGNGIIHINGHSYCSVLAPTCCPHKIIPHSQFPVGTTFRCTSCTNQALSVRHNRTRYTVAILLSLIISD